MKIMPRWKRSLLVHLVLPVMRRQAAPPILLSYTVTLTDGTVVRLQAQRCFVAFPPVMERWGWDRVLVAYIGRSEVLVVRWRDVKMVQAEWTIHVNDR